VNNDHPQSAEGDLVGTTDPEAVAAHTEAHRTIDGDSPAHG